MLIDLLQGGLNALLEYLSVHVLTCLVPAFFIAGGIRTFVTQTSVLKHFGPSANKWFSYGIASTSGAILAVSSCTVIPLFAGLYVGGASIGPATTFLYSSPAINVLAMVYSTRLLGLDLGTPALIINKKVKSSGRIPPKKQLKVWIEEAAKRSEH